MLRSLCVLCALVVLLPAAALAADGPAPKVVVPFDFESKWDNGRYGQMVGDLIWKKITREKGVVTMDAMQDVRDLCSANNIHITLATPLDEVRKVVRDQFDAQVGVWGSIERAPGTDGEIYDLTIKCVDFSGPEPVVVYEKTARTNSVSEVPHLYVKEMLDKLCNRQPGQPSSPDPDAEERWKSGPNLVVGGDLEKGTKGVPLGWEPRGGHYREPLGDQVKWIPEAGNPSNHVIRLTVSKAVAESETLMYYSKEFPVAAGATYRFQCRWRSNGPTVKVFIKCYDEMGTDYERETTAVKQDPADPSSSQNAPKGQQRREVYRSQQNLKGPNNTWNVQTQDFTPKHTKYTPRWGRIMVLIYLTEGVVEFDDFVVKQIVPAKAEAVAGDKRHSIGTKVTLKEMEENERRGKESRDKLRKESPREKKEAKQEE